MGQYGVVEKVPAVNAIAKIPTVGLGIYDRDLKLVLDSYQACIGLSENFILINTGIGLALA
jgi:hypothetical protein